MMISKQIQQRARIGKIFARWHLAIATTSAKIIKACVRALRLLNGLHPCGNIRPTQLSFVA